MSRHKKQHFVSKCYLRAWCDPDRGYGRTPFVWRFNADGSDPKRKAPENIFHERDMYTLTGRDGERLLFLEHGLSELESMFAKIRREKLSRQQKLTEGEQFALCAFVAAARSRTPAAREHIRKQWIEPLRMGERMLAWAKTATVEQKRRAAQMGLPSKGPGMSLDQVREIVEKPMQTMLGPIIATEAPLLMNLDVAIWETEDDIGFITSDRPCIWFDPESFRRPPFYRGPALMYKTIEITMPLSPTQCLFLNRQGLDDTWPSIKADSTN
jgi:hypothetical protein